MKELEARARCDGWLRDMVSAKGLKIDKVDTMGEEWFHIFVSESAAVLRSAGAIDDR